MKRKISTKTLLGNWRNWGTWKWHLYQFYLVRMVQSPKDWYWDTGICKLEDNLRPSKLQHYWDRPEYLEESWRPEETCSYSVMAWRGDTTLPKSPEVELHHWIQFSVISRTLPFVVCLIVRTTDSAFWALPGEIARKRRRLVIKVMNSY